MVAGHRGRFGGEGVPVFSDIDGLPECFSSVTHPALLNLTRVWIFAVVGTSFQNLCVSVYTFSCDNMHSQALTIASLSSTVSVFLDQGCLDFPKAMIHLNILGARRVT
jgi:hypothetical protein